MDKDTRDFGDYTPEFGDGPVAYLSHLEAVKTPPDFEAHLLTRYLKLFGDRMSKTERRTYRERISALRGQILPQAA